MTGTNAQPTPSPSQDGRPSPPSTTPETAAERQARAARILKRARDALIVRKVWHTASDAAP
jgi:hypothetical protein